MKTFQSGQWAKREGFRSFEPALINRHWFIDQPQVLEAMSKADRQLGRLDMFSEYIPNLQLFTQMHVVKEATKSSRIEDTKTEIEEAVMPEYEIAIERRDDWHEVNNYVKAMDEAMENLKNLPFSNRLLKHAHHTLMQGVRGENKTPGEYRRSQNWIGGSNPGNARFVPPCHENVISLMSDMELFAHNDEINIPPLIKIGIMHYQFETIHPFLDGNGRIGRLMIPLFLISNRIIQEPVLYLSDYLEKHREEYYDRLSRVRNENAIGPWLHFFLDGIHDTAKKGVQTFQKIMEFQRHWEAEIVQYKPTISNGLTVLRHLFKQPCVNAQILAKVAEVSMPTSYKIIERLEKLGLLVEITGAKRSKLFLFKPYLKLFH